MSLSNAERQARWRARRAAEIERLRKAAARQGKGEPASGAPGREAALQARIRNLEVQVAYERQARRYAEAEAKAGPKPARAPVDPDSELARAKAKIVELEARLRAVVKERDHCDQLLHGAGLSKATLNAVRKALHTDHATHSTPETREAALGLLNAELDRHEKRARR
jgi:hypothetical protein